MQKSKLIRIIKALPQEELDQFSEFIHSPFHNKNKKIEDFFGIIQQFHPDYDSPQLSKEEVFPRLFGRDTPYKAHQIRRLMSDMVRLLEHFLVYLEMEKQSILKSRLLADAFTQHNLLEQLQQTLKTAAAHQQKRKYRDEQFFLDQFELTTLEYSVQLADDQNRSAKSSMDKLMYNLDVFYIASKLKYACAVENSHGILGVNYKVHLVEKIQTFLKEQQQYHEVPIVEFYYTLLKLLQNGKTPTHFFHLKTLIREQGNVLPLAEQYNIYIALTNYANRKLKEGYGEYLRELFDLYKDMLTKKMLVLDQYISPHHYKNIATIALQLKEFDWAEQFIYQYKKEVDPEFRASVFSYNLAHFYFCKKDYDLARTHLLKVTFIDVFYHLSYKKLLLQTYYELQEQDALASSIEAFRTYVRRDKKLSAAKRKAYLNFVKFVAKLNRIQRGGRKNPAKLLPEISATKPMVDHQWLVEKTEALMGNVD